MAIYTGQLPLDRYTSSVIITHLRNDMQNPFVYGEIVPGEAFVDREVELDRLVTDLAGGPEGLPHLAAALRQVVADPPGARGAAPAGRAHGRGHRQQLQLLPGVSRRIRGRACGARNEMGPRAHVADGRDPSTRPEIRYEPKDTGLGRFSVAFPLVTTERDVTRLANEVFALPGQLAAARKRTVVVALDEFQAVDGFNGGSVEHALRAAAQQQRQVGYVFAGSEPSLMEQMIGPRRPFYKAGPVMRLQKIPADVFARVHRARASQERHQAGGRPRRRHRGPGGQPAVRRAAAGARNVGRRAGRGAGSVTLENLHATLGRLLAEQETMFEALWQRLTLAQRAMLRAVVLQGRTGTALGRHARPSSARRTVHDPDIARRAVEAGPAAEGRAAIRGGRLAPPRVGGEEDVL